MAVEPPAPAYDLAADRARIESVARDELGEGTRVQTAQGVFVLVAAPGWNAHALAASTELTATVSIRTRREKERSSA